MTYSQFNIEQLFQLIGSFPNQKYGESTHYDYIKTIDSAWPNQLINLSCSENEIDIVLDQIEKDSEKGEIPDLLMLNPSFKNYSIIDQLKKRKYNSSRWIAMTHDLNFLVIQNPIPDFQVKRVSSKSDFEEWLKIVEIELMGNHSLNAEVFNKLLENDNFHFFLGFEGKKPTATSFLFVTNKNAGVYFVSTKNTHRKKGFGREMTIQCILKAKELECINVELQATEIGKGVYKALGFVEQGTIDVFRIKKTSNNKTYKQ
jgi:predicted GNAT family N-acyltransferase